MRSDIVTDAIDLSALLREVADAGHGAVSVFLGTVRDVNDGRTVSGMEYTAYTSMAVAEPSHCDSQVPPSIARQVEHILQLVQQL